MKFNGGVTYDKLVTRFEPCLYNFLSLNKGSMFSTQIAEEITISSFFNHGMNGSSFRILNGKTHIALGELVEAREVLLSVGRTKVASDETEKSAAARTEAADLAEQLRGKIPTLTVKVTGVPEGTAIQILVDGALVPAVGLGAIRKTNPGSHTVIVRASKTGEATFAHSVVRESDQKEIARAVTRWTTAQPG